MEKQIETMVVKADRKFAVLVGLLQRSSQCVAGAGEKGGREGDGVTGRKGGDVILAGL